MGDRLAEAVFRTPVQLPPPRPRFVFEEGYLTPKLAGAPTGTSWFGRSGRRATRRRPNRMLSERRQATKGSQKIRMAGVEGGGAWAACRRV